MESEPHPHGPSLICSTAAFFGRPLGDAFGHIAEAGFVGVEVMVTRDPATQRAPVLRELSRQHGLAIRAIHAPFLLMTRTVWGTDPIGKIDRAVELSRETGAALVVVHPPYRWQTEYRRWVDERLPDLARDTGARVGVENMFPVRWRGGRGVRLHARQSISDLERYPHVVLDTSHAAVAGLDPFEAVRRLGDRLVHVHLSNNAGRGWDSHLPLDQGVLPISELLDLLGTEGFSGNVSLELDLRRYLEDDDAIRRVLASNLAICRDRLPQPV
ncbi:MAG: sugar phosphate isomerase/epimerase [Actinobacteria bacterium]|nr:MAG: sugar phosphate isomerase/epimerase [Actinomycetota bacterium]